MNEAMKKAIADHVERYQSSNGEDGGELFGLPVLLLTTTGRKSGKQRTAPLCYIQHEDGYVIAASAGGARKHPAWFLNLSTNPDVVIQVRDVISKRRAVISTGEERERLWTKLTDAASFYQAYQKKTERFIPVVSLRPR